MGKTKEKGSTKVANELSPVEASDQAESAAEESDSKTKSKKIFAPTIVAVQTGPTTMTTTKTVTIGGVTIELEDIENAVSDACLYPKGQRPIEPKELLALKDRAVQKVLATPFDVLRMDITDKKILNEYHSVFTSLKQLKSHLLMYDMLDVFTIVLPTPATGSPNTYTREVEGTKDLFEDYMVLKEAQIKTSNAWYNKWPKRDQQFHVNLLWSAEFIRKNTAPSLLNRIDDRMGEVSAGEGGGPLLLWNILLVLSTRTRKLLWQCWSKQLMTTKSQQCRGRIFPQPPRSSAVR
jgi:hypothetical protein